MPPRSFSELSAVGAGTGSAGSDAPDTSPYYGTWGADTGASMLDGTSNTTGVNGNTQRGQLNSFGKEIGSDMSYDDWMQFGGGNFGDAPPTRQSHTDAQLAGDPNMGATTYHGNGGGSGGGSGGGYQGPAMNSSGRQDTTGLTPWGSQFLQNTGSTQRQFGGFFAEGGAIPEEEGDPNQMAQGPANGLMAQIAKSLTSVQEVLAYGRQKHGLGNSNEGAIPGADKVAGRMPSVPGNPSDSGVRPPQPMPGPLPPTSNPFGKRADADQDGDSDAPGAIDEEETA